MFEEYTMYTKRSLINDDNITRGGVCILDGIKITVTTRVYYLQMVNSIFYLH